MDELIIPIAGIDFPNEDKRRATSVWGACFAQQIHVSRLKPLQLTYCHTIADAPCPVTIDKHDAGFAARSGNHHRKQTGLRIHAKRLISLRLKNSRAVIVALTRSVEISHDIDCVKIVIDYVTDWANNNEVGFIVNHKILGFNAYMAVCFANTCWLTHDYWQLRILCQNSVPFTPWSMIS
jgi:hypothetical protein